MGVWGYYVAVMSPSVVVCQRSHTTTVVDRRFGVQTLHTQDISDSRHLGPRTLRHQCGTVRLDTSALVCGNRPSLESELASCLL